MLFSMMISFFIAALSGMGVGGGGLFVIFLAFATDLPQTVAQGMNLLFFLFSAGASTLIHLNKRHIYGTAVLLMAGAGIAGALIGTALVGVFSDGLLRKLFGGLLVISGILSLRRKEAEKDMQNLPPS